MADKPLINIDELEYTRFGDGGRFEAKLLRISAAIGARDLGYNITVVPPGRRAFPFHRHHHNEEMFFILQGTGTLRYGDGEYPLREGDVIACPAGPAGAHQIINSGRAELRYLAVSTNRSPEVAEYPDSGKVGMYAGDFADTGAEMDLRLLVKTASAVDYFDGESE